MTGFGTLAQYHKVFLNKIDSTNHPFSEIVILIESKSSHYHDSLVHEFEEWARSAVNVPVTVQRRSNAPGMDLCTAEVSTGYFMMTSVNSAPIDSIRLMFAADGTNRPVIPFVPAENDHCSNFKMCVNAMDEAKEFYPQMDRYFLADEVLYSENLRIKFCDELRSRRGYGPVHSHISNANAPGASATNYMAYLYASNTVGSSYLQSNSIKEGSRGYFISTDVEMPLGLKYHIADISDGNAKGVDLPVLWHIPKTGGSSMKVLLAQCRHLAAALQVGVTLERRRGNLSQDQLPESLYYVTNGKERYVSVDLSTPDGLVKAKELKLLGSGLADVAITHLITAASIEMFSSDPGQRARVFSIFRHPVDRAVSKFYYLQEATWERTYDPTLQYMTIEEYAAENKDLSLIHI